MATRNASARSEGKRASTRRVWSRAVERASLAMRGPLLERALRNYGVIDNAARMQAAREIAETRGAELTLAYRNVIMIAYGYKRRADDGGGEALVPTPCVIFVVRRKWQASRDDSDDPQRLPQHLLAYATWNDRRLLVAVPTDVQVETRFSKARPESSREICAQPTAHGDQYGVLTVLVDVTGSQVGRYGLTALHVLSPGFNTAGGAPLDDTHVERAIADPQPPQAPDLGTSLPIGGQLVPPPGISFDAQLFQVDNAAEIDRMLRGMPLSTAQPYIADPSRFDQLLADDPGIVFELLISDNHPKAKGMRPRLFARFSAMSTHAFGIEYGMLGGGVMNVHHSELIHLECLDDRTMPGDSGTPVVVWTEPERCTLVGMHIARDGSTSYVLPAWQLFYAPNFLGTLSEDSEIHPISQPAE